ncbi:MAG: carboxypeptidase-like regulatory domain-containing protein [Flavobacteriales bacterium]|nr:carboxypeptidase-like regulatory domain-containing protein [Flavobacteriales bacterium]
MRRLTAIVFILGSLLVQAQTTEIRGFIYNKKTGEPVPYANIFIKEIQKGTVSDDEGLYVLNGIPTGKHTLIVRALGYDSVLLKLDFEAGKMVMKNILLNQSGIDLEEVNVSAERQKKKKDVYISITNITPRELKMMPNIGGEPDLVQFLQVLPGVVFSGDQGGQLYIRGGSPIMNKVMIDGMTLYNPFHSIGLFSVFDSDILKNTEVYSAGFGAEYGGRISAIIDVKTRDGDKKNIKGKVNLNTFTSKIMLEGPLKKFNPEDGSSSSFILSYKNSFLDRSSKLFYNYVGAEKLPYSFEDFYGKISFNNSNGSRINFFGFSHSDKVDFKNVSKYQWDSKGFGGKFYLLPQGSSTLINATFTWSSYTMGLTETDAKPRNSDINGFYAAMNFTNFINDDEFQYGLEINGFTTDFKLYNSANRFISQENNTTELNGFARYKYISAKKKLIIEPGFRIQYYASFGDLSPEPRLRMKYNYSKRVRFKAATGMYSQNLMSASSDKDIVNLFYGFLSGPDEYPQQVGNKTFDSRLQKSIHGVAGIEYDINKENEINFEVYIKEFTQLTNVNRDKIFDNTLENQNRPFYQRVDYIGETGRAYGYDVTFKSAYSRLYFWIVYSYNNVSRYDGITTYQPHFDRRHNVNILGTYDFLKDKSLQFSARWNFGSGFPFTQTQGYYEQLNFAGGFSTDYTKTNGDLGIIYAGQNLGRLPYYHRLDVSLTKTYKLKRKNGKKNDFEIIFSCTNVYNRANIFYFDRVNYKRVNQLPILPSLAVSYSF